MHEACIRLSVALGQLQRADSHVPGNWDQSYIAIYRGDRERLTRLYESAPPGLRMWIAPQIGIIDDGGDQAETPLGPYFKRRHFADLASGPSPETLQLFAEHWQMSPQKTQISQLLAEVYANALERVGDRDRAIEVLQTATSNRRATITTTPDMGHNWVSARNAYAQLLRRLGRDADAEPVERDLLSMLSEADADHVIAAGLRARYGGSAPRAIR